MSGRPVPRRGTSAVIIGLLALLTAVLIVVFVLRLARSPEAKVQLGTDTFVLGPAAHLAPSATQAPLLFQALRGKDLDIYVQHLGTDPIHGWLAFEAHRPGGPPSCTLRWQPQTRTFVDPCDHRTYPADGQGLNQYRVIIDSKTAVSVDLQASTGTTPSPT